MSNSRILGVTVTSGSVPLTRGAGRTYGPLPAAPRVCGGYTARRQQARMGEAPRGWDSRLIRTPRPLETITMPSRNLAARAGRWSARHRKTAILGWIAFVVLAT